MQGRAAQASAARTAQALAMRAPGAPTSGLGAQHREKPLGEGEWRVGRRLPQAGPGFPPGEDPGGQNPFAQATRSMGSGCTDDFYVSLGSRAGKNVPDH